MCRNLIHQSLIWSWDQGEEEGVMAVTQAPDCPFLIKPYPSSSGFCQVLGSASGNQSSLPSSSCTTKLLQQLFPPLLDALQEPRSGLLLCGPPGETRAGVGGDRRILRIPPLFLILFRKLPLPKSAPYPFRYSVPALHRSCTPCPGALYPADYLALVLEQNSAASGSVGPRFLPAPDPEGLTCE